MVLEDTVYRFQKESNFTDVARRKLTAAFNREARTEATMLCVLYLVNLL